MKVDRFSSGAPLEEKMGYSRMIKAGNIIMIGGTTSVQPDGSVHGENDAYEQARYIFARQIRLLSQIGASRNDVVSVDAFVVDMSDSSAIAQAYTEIFHDVRPLCTVVGTTALNRPSQLVEIKMTAVKD